MGRIPKRPTRAGVDRAGRMLVGVQGRVLVLNRTMPKEESLRRRSTSSPSAHLPRLVACTANSRPQADRTSCRLRRKHRRTGGCCPTRMRVARARSRRPCSQRRRFPRKHRQLCEEATIHLPHHCQRAQGNCRRCSHPDQGTCHKAPPRRLMEAAWPIADSFRGMRDTNNSSSKGISRLRQRRRRRRVGRGGWAPLCIAETKNASRALHKHAVLMTLYRYHYHYHYHHITTTTTTSSLRNSRVIPCRTLLDHKEATVHLYKSSDSLTMFSALFIAILASSASKF